MFQRFIQTPLKFWFRMGVVFIIPWLMAATLWHVSSLSREVDRDLSRHLQECYSNGKFDYTCGERARDLLVQGYHNAWFTAFGVSLLQLFLLWVAGIVIVTGTRWAAHAL